MTKRSIHLAAGLAVIVCVAGANMTSVHARVRTHNVTQPGGELQVLVRAGHSTTIRLKSSLLQFEEPESWRVVVDVNPKTETITLFAPEGTRDDQAVGTVLAWTQLYNLHIHVRAARPDEQPDDIIIVNHEQLDALCSLQEQSIRGEAAAQTRVELSREHARTLAEKDAEIARLQDKNETEIDRRADVRIREQLLVRADRLGNGGVMASVERGDVRIDLVSAHRLGDKLHAELKVRNSGNEALKFQTVQAFFEDGKLDRLGGVSFEAGDQPPAGLVGFVRPNARVRGVVTIEDVGGVALPEQVSLSFKLANLITPIVLSFSPEEAFQEDLRQERARQSIVSVRVMGGAFWIADGEGNNELDATSMTGVGVRFTKGMNEMFALELQVVAGRTGTAQFDDVMVDGVQGTLTRSATLGRAQFGGSLRFGDQVIPHVSVGLGAQGASFDGQIASDGDTATDMDSSFEVNGFLMFGGGVDVRLGGSFIAGVAALLDLPLGGSAEHLFRSSLGVTGHLGYGW